MTTKMDLIVKGGEFCIEDIVRVARFNGKVTIAEECELAITKCRQLLESKIEQGDIVYGVNTGIGEFSETTLTKEETADFQKWLIYNHAAGMGDPLDIEIVRGAILSRINVQCHGHSGCRLVITEFLVGLLNAGVTPFVCKKGSVGACGDLAPMSQIALLLMGEGSAYYEGELLEGKDALSRAKLTPPGLHARDGLATINGCNVMTAMAALWLYDANIFLKHAEIAAAMSLEALNANLGPLNALIHKVRGFHGAVRSSAALRKLVEKDDSAEPPKKKIRVQDAYSMRSTPQVVGAAHDALVWARSQVEIELSGVGDNPIFFPDQGIMVSGANFQGSPVCVPMDMAGAAITMVCVLSERRLNRLVNPALSGGLPPFLSTHPGMMSGMMLSQYTADMQIVEQKMWSAPAYIQSIPAAADQEDFVSMGYNTALKNLDILSNAQAIIGIEMMAGAQALDMRRTEMGNDKCKYGSTYGFWTWTARCIKITTPCTH
eukprot:GEMP01038190.1.p1 GENE.GEMP01038190.1~~GEMP01038190.1.p1  ORF type:complete len:490 (+),score=117.40 GEMP01038190.1:131-1600(+)